MAMIHGEYTQLVKALRYKLRIRFPILEFLTSPKPVLTGTSLPVLVLVTDKFPGLSYIFINHFQVKF